MRNKTSFTAKDLTGRTIGNLTVIRPTGKKYYGYWIWLCQCKCGKTCKRASQVLLKPKPVRSCGCIPGGRQPLPNGESYVRALFNKARKNARREGKTFSLSLDRFRELITANCRYCGATPTRRNCGGLAGEYSANGIDRIDSRKGYRVGNVVTACWQCNRAKGNLPVLVFLDWIKSLAAHQATAPFQADTH